MLKTMQALLERVCKERDLSEAEVQLLRERPSAFVPGVPTDPEERAVVVSSRPKVAAVLCTFAMLLLSKRTERMCKDNCHTCQT